MTKGNCQLATDGKGESMLVVLPETFSRDSLKNDGTVSPRRIKQQD
jgi:hypothetical protein